MPDAALPLLVPYVWRVVLPMSSVKYRRSSSSASFTSTSPLPSALLLSFIATLTPQFASIFLRPSFSPYLFSWLTSCVAPTQKTP